MSVSGLRWEDVRDEAVHILFGKTVNARRTIPLTARAGALLEMRRASCAIQRVGLSRRNKRRAHAEINSEATTSESV